MKTRSLKKEINRQNAQGQVSARWRMLGRKMITTVILTLTAVVTFAVYAAFIEPSAAPSSSNQDFAENILGANNADNGFSSTNVTSNADGSIIEVLEYIQSQL